MSKSNLIKERDKRTINRKLKKEYYDSIISLSTPNEPSKTVRLLDEGMFVYGDGSPWFFMMKGTIEKFLNGQNVFLDNITDDFIGTVNLGHFDFASFPFILGHWDKSDLSMVDNEDGRKGLDINVHLDSESAFVKELRRMPYDLAVSAEFYTHYNEEASRELGVECIDEIYIDAYGIVGDGGNVGSNNIELKGGDTSMYKDKKLEIVEPITEEEVEETKVETEVEEVEETKTEETTEVEETEEVEVEAEEETEADEEAETVNLDTVLETVKELKNKVENLEKENKELKEQLATKEAEDAKFVEKFKSLTAVLSEDNKVEKTEKKLVTKNHIGTDGIGE